MILRRTATFDFVPVRVRGLRIARVRRLEACGPRDVAEHARELADVGVVDLRVLGVLESRQIGWMIAVDGCMRVSGASAIVWLLHPCMRLTLTRLRIGEILRAVYSEDEAAD